MIEPSMERAREISGPEFWSGIDARRDVLIWALNELDARNGEIRCLKTRIAALESVAALPSFNHEYAPNSRGGCRLCRRDERDGE